MIWWERFCHIYQLCAHSRGPLCPKWPSSCDSHLLFLRADKKPPLGKGSRSSGRGWCSKSLKGFFFKQFSRLFKTLGKADAQSLQRTNNFFDKTFWNSESSRVALGRRDFQQIQRQGTASDFSILSSPLYVRQACQERLEGKYWPFCNFCSTPQWDWRFSRAPPDYVIQQALDWIIVWLILWWPQSFHTVMMIMICGRRTYYLGPTLYGLLWHICFSFAWQTVVMVMWLGATLCGPGMGGYWYAGATGYGVGMVLWVRLGMVLWWEGVYFPIVVVRTVTLWGIFTPVTTHAYIQNPHRQAVIY